MKALKLSLFLAGIAAIASGISAEPAEAHVAGAVDGGVQSVWDVTEADGEDMFLVDVGSNTDGIMNYEGAGDTLYLYLYDSTEKNSENAAWPGVAMNRIGDTTRWYASFTEGLHDRAIVSTGDGKRQTQDISLDVYKKYEFDRDYRVVTTINTWHSDWGNGQYDYYTTSETSHEYSPQYFRFFLDRGLSGDGYENYVTYQKDGREFLIPATGYAQANNTTWYGQYEIPVEILGGQFKVVTASNQLWFTDESDWYDVTTNLAHSLYRINWKSQSNETSTWPVEITSVEKATLNEGQISAWFFGNYVISGLFTCLPSEVNGYLAASEIKANWMTPDDETYYIYEMLNEVIIDDYAVATSGVEDYNEYYQTAEKVPGTNAQAKLDFMLQLEAAHDGVTDASVTALFSEPENVAGITAGALVLVSILGFSVFYFARRRKHASN